MTTTLRPLGPEEPLAHGGVGRRFAVCVNGRPVGDLGVSADARAGVGVGRISWLEIGEADRGRGRGTVAALAAEEVLRGWDCRESRVALSAEAGAGPAGALARTLGYQEWSSVMVKDLGERPALPPGSTAEELTEQEFAHWSAAAVESFTQSLADAGTPQAAARSRAELSHRALLPEGRATEGHHLRVLRHEGVEVGTVWVALRSPDRPRALGAEAEPQDAEAPCGYVYDVVVRAERRGEGHGRTLMAVAETLCLDAGLDRLGLNVFAHNPAARSLYDSLGYRPVLVEWVKPLL
ncbi:GNAT family N-acetyltransferase [Streptomyces sp. NPDC059740]|uniref:GNAT family N-acetyltransferase n=1 Tax=Streptomyces sp. NPDC059740 TaxID=3346926 RepID=UPI0036586B57